MKLSGKKVELVSTGVVTIQRGDAEIEIKIKALPLGVESKVTEVFPDLAPPKTFVEGKGGKILRDPQNRRPLMEEDRNDLVWKQKQDQTSRMQLMWMLWHSIDHTDVEWEFVKQFEGSYSDDWDRETRTRFFVAMFEELRAAGFTMGDVNQIIQQVMQVSNLKTGEIETARDSF